MCNSKFVIVCTLLLCTITVCKKFSNKDKPAWAKKDIRDYTDADLERLYDQWEEDDEPLEDDELPEHLRPQPKLDLSQVDMSNPENILKLSKKGKTLMTFVDVAGNPTREETERITKLWQTSLWNSHIQAERYLIDDSRAIFLFKDGSQAWEARDFLVEQPELKEVIIESKPYPGKYYKKEEKEEDASSEDNKIPPKEDL